MYIYVELGRKGGECAIPHALYKTHTYICIYGVATISRLLEITGFLCRI